MRRGLLAALAAALLLAGCGGELQTPGEALRIFGDDLPEAFLGEQYAAQIRAVGGLRPFTFALEDGELPPGLTLEAGVLRGVPTETGTYQFTVAVSDANLSRTFQDYSLSVVERPPPTLSLVVPQTEVRGPVVVQARIEDASELRAVSALVEWDEEQFDLVEGSVAAAVRGTALLWREEAGSLQVDMAALGGSWNGEPNLFRFTLEPVAPSVLRPRLTALLLDDRGNEHLQSPGAQTPTAPETGSEDSGEDEADVDTDEGGQQ